MLNRVSVYCLIRALVILGLAEMGSAAVAPHRNAARVHHHNSAPRDTGTVVYQFVAPSNNVDGMAWDGDYLWLGSDGLDRQDPGDRHNIFAFYVSRLSATAYACYTCDGSYFWHI